MSASLNTTMNGTRASVCYRSGDLAAEKIRKTFTYCSILVVSLTGNYLIGNITYKKKTMRSMLRSEPKKQVYRGQQAEEKKYEELNHGFLFLSLTTRLKRLLLLSLTAMKTSFLPFLWIIEHSGTDILSRRGISM